MRQYLMAVCLCAFPGIVLSEAAAQESDPIIDMHLHSYDDADYFVAPDDSGKMAPPGADVHFEATYEIMRRRDIAVESYY